MPKIVITHKVKDVEQWLKFHAERVAQLSPFATNVTDHAAVDGSNNVALTMDVHDMPAMQAVLASPSPELAAAMDRHGVIAPIVAHVEK
jgi:hypothetical protein